jgi:DNA-binding ferritin-like protein (Dps family)
MENVNKDFSYNYDRIVQVLWKKGNKKKKNLYFEEVFEMMPHGHSEISDCVLSPQAYLH